MSTATVTPITKNISTEEAIERGYRLLTASVDSPEFHGFVSKQIDSNGDRSKATFFDRRMPQMADSTGRNSEQDSRGRGV